MSLQVRDETIVFSGFRDQELETKIKASGGRVTTAISKLTTIVIIKELTNKALGASKAVKAKELGIKLVTLAEFLNVYSVSPTKTITNASKDSRAVYYEHVKGITMEYSSDDGSSKIWTVADYEKERNVKLKNGDLVNFLDNREYMTHIVYDGQFILNDEGDGDSGLFINIPIEVTRDIPDALDYYKNVVAFLSDKHLDLYFCIALSHDDKTIKHIFGATPIKTGTQFIMHMFPTEEFPLDYYNDTEDQNALGLEVIYGKTRVTYPYSPRIKFNLKELIKDLKNAKISPIKQSDEFDIFKITRDNIKKFNNINSIKSKSKSPIKKPMTRLVLDMSFNIIVNGVDQEHYLDVSTSTITKLFPSRDWTIIKHIQPRIWIEGPDNEIKMFYTKLRGMVG